MVLNNSRFVLALVVSNKLDNSSKNSVTSSDRGNPGFSFAFRSTFSYLECCKWFNTSVVDGSKLLAKPAPVYPIDFLASNIVNLKHLRMGLQCYGGLD